MIKNNTVFILGAGASAPLFPLGKGLVDQICKNIEDTNSRFHLRNAIGFDMSKILSFGKALRNSNKDSIDGFLEHNKDLVDLGKAAIATSLIKYENQDCLDNEELRPHWYGYLWNKMTDGCDFDDLDKNNITFITFNYDRSLEQFLFRSALALYQQKTEKEIAEKVSRIKIIHLHGTLGSLPWQKKTNQRAYSENADDVAIKIASESIRIIHENNLGEDPIFQMARELINDSPNVFILGFGFHSQNVIRLGLNKPIKRETIYSTSKHLSVKEIQERKDLCAQNVEFDLINGNDCLEFIRNRL